MVAWLLAAALSAAPQMIVPRVECGAAADAQAQSRCQAVATTLAAAITAEGLSRGPGERCEVSPSCFELVAKIPGRPVFFELRDAKGIRLIAHTDEGDYRLPHKNEDLLALAGFMTFVLAPLAAELHKPTSRADEEWAWRTTARRVLRQALKKDQRFLGATEVRGQHWTATMAAPRVGRVPVVEELMVIQDKDYAPIDAETDEAREACFGASQAVVSLPRGSRAPRPGLGCSFNSVGEDPVGRVFHQTEDQARSRAHIRYRDRCRRSAGRGGRSRQG